MLNEPDRELISAAVDGPLDPAQDQAFRRLIAESVDAATLYRQLLGDRDRLRSLRRIPAPAGLAERIIERTRPTPLVKPSRSLSGVARPGWVAYAIAASIFLAVSAGSFWLTLRTSENDGDQAERLALPRSGDESTGDPIQSLASHSSPEPVAPPRARFPEPIGEPRSADALAVREPVGTPLEAAPSPRAFGSADVVGSRPTLDVTALNPARVRLPLLAGVAEFDRPEIRTRLLADLTDEPAHRLDLFARDPLRAVEVLQSAARSAGLTVSVDSLAHERMKRKLPSSWMLFSEALTADEIVKLLGQLAVQTRNDPTPALVTGHLVPAQAAESRDLRDLLGLDAAGWKRPKGAAPKSIASGTVDQVTANLAKKGPARPAILVTYFPPGHRPPLVLTKELKAFLERREERRPNSVPLLVVIRPSA